MTGRDALHRLDDLIASMRSDFDIAVHAADDQRARCAEIARLRADGYQQLAHMRLNDLESGSVRSLTELESRAVKLLDDHQVFVETLTEKLNAAARLVERIEARRRTCEQEADAALDAYETRVSETEQRLQSDAEYLSLVAARENAQAIVTRAEQKLELAREDRAEKGAPYDTDPLFSYLWKRKFRTTEYASDGVYRMLDNWVARICGYDAAYLNYARLTELPERLAEHVSRMKLDEAEAEATISAFEAAELKKDGADELNAVLVSARARLQAIDVELADAEAHLSEFRIEQEQAATGDSGPRGEARKIIQEGLASVSFPDLRVLASETVTVDDDRIVDALVKLRTEELQLEVNRNRIEMLPQMRRSAVEAVELARRKFKQAGLDSPYVILSEGTFEAEIDSFRRSREPNGEALWRELANAVRRAPNRDDQYFGGRRRRNAIGLPDVGSEVGGLVVREILREVGRSSGSSGGFGGRGSWPSRSGGGLPGGTRPTSRSGGKKGGFKTTGRF